MSYSLTDLLLTTTATMATVSDTPDLPNGINNALFIAGVITPIFLIFLAIVVSIVIICLLVRHLSQRKREFCGVTTELAERLDTNYNMTLLIEFMYVLHIII